MPHCELDSADVAKARCSQIFFSSMDNCCHFRDALFTCIAKLLGALWDFRCGSVATCCDVLASWTKMESSLFGRGSEGSRIFSCCINLHCWTWSWKKRRNGEGGYYSNTIQNVIQQRRGIGVSGWERSVKCCHGTVLFHIPLSWLVSVSSNRCQRGCWMWGI